MPQEAVIFKYVSCHSKIMEPAPASHLRVGIRKTEAGYLATVKTSFGMFPSHIRVLRFSS